MQSKDNPSETLENMLKRKNELQYAAMAHSLSGQQLPDNFGTDFAALENRIKQATTARLLSKMNDMQYTAMAHAQAGQPLPAQFNEEYSALEKEIAQNSTTD